ncbi:MAG TPA: class I SAM-dependent methyltransferase [Solirubrobacteraceae bacterium]|jgi:SAM-dependent methyltransferase
MPTERRLSFGEVAELYDRVRPSYPAALVDDVLSFSGAAAGDRALEVGAGTGKATALFAARGLEILALEPSSGMAAVASGTCAQYENVRIEQSEFERWRSDRRGFELLFSAQAWHWIPRELRYAKAREVLAPSGVLAVFWNRLSWDSSPLTDELAAIYRRVAPDLGAGAGPGPMDPARASRERWGDWGRELAEAPGFGPPEFRSYMWRERYTTDSYLELLRTHSDHIVLDEPRRGQLFDAIAAVIDGRGGAIELDYVTDLWMARAE